MRNRVPAIRESTVRIFVNGQPAGSGFVVDAEGTVITCFHVVEQLNPGQGNQMQIMFSQNIEVEFADSTHRPAQIASSCQNTGFLEALSKDY